MNCWRSSPAVGSQPKLCKRMRASPSCRVGELSSAIVHTHPASGSPTIHPKARSDFPQGRLNEIARGRKEFDELSLAGGLHAERIRRHGSVSICPRAPRHQKLCRQQINRLAVLIHRRASKRNDAVLWLRSGRPDFDDFTVHTQCVARAGRPGPRNFAAKPEDAVCEV